MRKKKNEIFVVIKDDILNNLKSYIIVTVILLAGILLGVMIINNLEDKEEMSKYVSTYIDEAKTLENVDYLGELKNDIRNNILLVLALWFSGTTIIGIPIVLGIILFRGFCLGYTIAACVVVLGKLKGILFVLITIFLQNIIFIPAIIILGVSSIKLYKSIIKDRRKENIKLSIFKHSVLSLIIVIFLILASVIKTEVSYRLIVNLAKYF